MGALILFLPLLHGWLEEALLLYLHLLFLHALHLSSVLELDCKLEKEQERVGERRSVRELGGCQITAQILSAVSEYHDAISLSDPAKIKQC